MEKEKNKNINSNESTSESIINIENLKISFGTNDVLKDISLTLTKEQNLVILGKSGSGKSVLIKCLVGLIEPDEGEITILNKNIADLSNKELNKLRKKIGFLFQSGALYDSMTVNENLAFPLRDEKKIDKTEKDRLVLEALTNVGLESAGNKMPSELSGGMRKRIGLARTLILKPEIILYDEPTTGLDPITSKEMSELILDIQKKYHTSSIIITHDIACVKITANSILILKDGLIHATGTYDELSSSSDEWVKSFFN